MPKEVRVVALLPDEDEMRSGHELRHESAPLGRAGERIRADARPAGMIAGIVVSPELFLLLGKHELDLDSERALVGLVLRHADKASEP